MEPAERATAAEVQPTSEQTGGAAAAEKNPSCSPAEAYETVTAVLRKIQRARGRRLFVLVTNVDDQTDGIDDQTYGQVSGWRAELKEAGSDEKLDVLIHSPGGWLSTCYQIARLLARSANAWEALVPEVAASGATLIALGSARIVMSEVAQLSPIDPQVISKRHEKFFVGERQSPLEAFQALKYLREVALASLDVSMNFLLGHNVTPKPALETSCSFGHQIVQPMLAKIDPYDLGAFALDANLAAHYAERIANPADLQKKTQRNVPYRDLVYKYPAHEFVIDLEEAKILNFNVVEPPPELDVLFDEVRPYLDEVQHYVGLVPESEVKA